MSLEPLDIVNGTFGLLFVVISIILGIIIVLKYFKTKDKNFLLVGFTWIFLISGWYGTSASFLVALFTGGDGLSLEMILLLNFIPLPIALILWAIAFSNFLLKDKQFIFLLGNVIYVIIFYTVFFYFIFTNPNLIAEKISPVDTAARSYVLAVLLVIFIVIFFVTGVKFALETMKINDSETKLKGKLLLIAFPLFCIGGFLDASIPTTALTLIIFRLILILSAILFYGAFVLPNWIKRMFLK
ncbi:MAG: hypothetical protein ACFFDK_00440 [Promethearchaeota archaeon]